MPRKLAFCYIHLIQRSSSDSFLKGCWVLFVRGTAQRQIPSSSRLHRLPSCKSFVLCWAYHKRLLLIQIIFRMQYNVLLLSRNTTFHRCFSPPSLFSFHSNIGSDTSSGTVTVTIMEVISFGYYCLLLLSTSF